MIPPFLLLITSILKVVDEAKDTPKPLCFVCTAIKPTTQSMIATSNTIFLPVIEAKLKLCATTTTIILSPIIKHKVPPFLALISRPSSQGNIINLLKNSKKNAKKNTSDKNTIVDYSHIVSNLTNPCMNFTNISIWILDSRTSNHVCPHIKYFYDIKIISLIYIHFPNGLTIVAHFYGIVHLGPYLHLYDVFYIPQFNFSLISISKLCKNLMY